MRLAFRIRLGLVSALAMASSACARPPEATYTQALETVDRLMTYSHDREAAGRKFKETGKTNDACPNFRAAAVRAESAASVMKRVTQPDHVWDEAHGWSRIRSEVFSQEEAMRGQIKETCS